MSSKILITVILLTIGCSCYCQKIDSVPGKIYPRKLSCAVLSKLEKFQKKILDCTSKTLQRLEREEEKICRNRVPCCDTNYLNDQLSLIRQKYQALQNKLQQPANQVPAVVKPYLAHLDSLQVAFKFLRENGIVANDAIDRIDDFENKMFQVEEVKMFLRDRFYSLQKQFDGAKLAEELKQFNKQAYYYFNQVNYYKQILSDPQKIEMRCLEILSKTKIFQEFMRKNSLLASMFRVSFDPSEPNSALTVLGLQSRSQINGLIQQQLNASTNGQAQFNQNIQQGQFALQDFKNKLNKLRVNTSQEIPANGFSPNSERAKPFFKRLEFSVNIQTEKSTNYFPVTSDIGLSLGFKINAKSIVGIGISYKLGLGQNWRNIQLSGRGEGYRSFLDWNLKKSLWLTGGFELNHKIDLQNLSGILPATNKKVNTKWQKSGLVGLSKTIAMQSKFFKQTKLQLLWNFLSYSQRPRVSPILFRISYKF